MTIIGKSQRLAAASLVCICTFFALIVGLWSPSVAAADNFIILQSTTSTQNSGLLDAILPKFTKETGIDVHVVAVGTGQAIRNAQNGDGDVLLVHSKSAEERFVADGWGVERFDVMYNDFVIVGPKDDPAQVAGHPSVVDALKEIAFDDHPFVSRGDDSGTHKAEMSLWAAANVDAVGASGTWYLETGSGMGATLNVASGLDAYTMTDRATWTAFGNKGNLAIIVEGDARLFNQYGVMAVNPEIHPHVKAKEAAQLVDWLTGAGGQKAIADYQIDGQQLFFPNAN